MTDPNQVATRINEKRFTLYNIRAALEKEENGSKSGPKTSPTPEGTEDVRREDTVTGTTPRVRSRLLGISV